MLNGLSYPGLKCVLEFLEANKRIHISSRCPRLKHIERCVPLRLNTLHFRPNVVKLNEITYAIVARKEETTDHPRSELKYGDILIETRNWVYSRIYPAIRFSKQVRISESIAVEKRVRQKEGVQNYEVIRESIQGLMGGRENIRVDRLVFELGHSTILRLPSDFKVRINKLDSGSINPERLLPLIDFSSFPLKELRLTCPEKLDQSIVQSSEKLDILVDEEYSRNHLDDTLKLPNRSVIIEFVSMNEDGYSSIIDYWLDNKRETGKCFMINGNKTSIMQAAVDLMKKYDGEFVKLNGTKFSSDPDANYISIPLNEDFVIAIYAVYYREDESDSNHKIVIKTMPIDSFIPEKDFSEVTTLIEIKAPRDTLIDYLILAVLFLFFFAILLLILFVCSLIVYTIFTTFTLIAQLFV